MTKLLLVRHGESQANLENRFSGFTDTPLTSYGLLQVACTADHIAKNDAVAAVYSSDLQRAYFTGKAVADRFGLPVITMPALREIDGGLWENLSYDEIARAFPQSRQIWKTDIGNAVCDGGESVLQLQTRVVKAVREICALYPDATVVIATHATPIRSFINYCTEASITGMRQLPLVTNASVTRVNYTDGMFDLISSGEDRHLAALEQTQA